MSSHLYYRKVPKNPPKDKRLGDALKYALKKRIIGDNWNEKHELNENHVPYLEGLVDGGIEEALTLINEIAMCGAIEVWINE